MLGGSVDGDLALGGVEGDAVRGRLHLGDVERTRLLDHGLPQIHGDVGGLHRVAGRLVLAVLGLVGRHELGVGRAGRGLVVVPRGQLVHGLRPVQGHTAVRGLAGAGRQHGPPGRRRRAYGCRSAGGRPAFCEAAAVPGREACRDSSINRVSRSRRTASPGSRRTGSVVEPAGSRVPWPPCGPRHVRLLSPCVATRPTAPQPARAASTTSLASSWTRRRWSGPRKDSA